MKNFILQKIQHGMGKKTFATAAILLGAALTLAATGRGAHDHIGNFHFQVEISGTPVAGVIEVSGLTSESEVIEFRDGSEPDVIHLLPGLTRYNITLKRGLIPGDSLWQWRQNAIDGALDRRDGSVLVLDRQNRPVARYQFFNAWPKKWEGATFDASGNEVAIETITIVAERIELAE